MSIFTAQCYAERNFLSLVMASRLSVCNVAVLWSHRLQFFEDNFSFS